MIRFTPNDGPTVDPCPQRLGFPPLSSRFAVALRRQWMLGADLRDRLVSVTGAGHRFVGDLARRAARDLHGWDVPWQPAFASCCVSAGASAAGLRRAGTGNRCPWNRS